MYTIFRRDEISGLIEVATADTREAAEKLMARMRKLFPADQYELKETDGGSAGTTPSQF